MHCIVGNKVRLAVPNILHNINNTGKISHRYFCDFVLPCLPLFLTSLFPRVVSILRELVERDGQAQTRPPFYSYL